MTWGGAYNLISNGFSSSASSDRERPSEGAQCHRRRFPLPISTGALHTLDTPLPAHYQSPRGRRKNTLFFFFFGHPYSYYQSSRGRHKYTLFICTPLIHYQSPRGRHKYILLLWTPPCHPSYGRSTAFGLSRSLSRVQAGVAAP